MVLLSPSLGWLNQEEETIVFGEACVNNTKSFFTKGIKQSILGSSIILGLIITLITNNSFIGDLPTFDMESLKVTRCWSFVTSRIKSVSARMSL